MDANEKRQQIGYIRNEVIHNHNLDKTLQNFESRFGVNSMERGEFEYWFAMFTQDNNFEWRSDFSEPLTENQEKAFMVIAKKYGLQWQLKLRKLSKRIRGLIDSQPADYKNIHVTISSKSIYVKYDETRVQYTKDQRNGISYSDYSRKSKMSNLKIIKDKEYRKMALSDLNIVFSNRWNELDSLFIEYHQRVKMDRLARKKMEKNGQLFIEEFIPILSSRDFLHDVKKLSVQTDDLSTFQLILECMKPGVLLEMELVNIDFPKYHKSIEGPNNPEENEPSAKSKEKEMEEIMAEEARDEEQFMVRYEQKKSDYEALKGAEEWPSEEIQMLKYMEIDRDTITQGRIVITTQFQQTKRVYWLHDKMIRIPIEAFFNFNVFEIYPEEVVTMDIIMLTGTILDVPIKNFKRALFYHPSKKDLTNLKEFYNLERVNVNIDEDFVSKTHPDLKGKFYYHLGESDIYGSIFILKLTPRRSPEAGVTR